jgi:hypothetical protein
MALVIAVLILQALQVAAFAQDAPFAQDLTRYHRKAALETITGLNLRNSLRTCSEGGEKLKSKLYEFQCLDELCQGRRLPPREPFTEIERKRNAAQERLKAVLAPESVAKLKQGLSEWSKLINDELKNENESPLTNKDDRFLAAFILSQTDCEKFECSPRVKDLARSYVADVRSVYRDSKDLQVEKQSEALARYQKEQEEFLTRFPKLAPKASEFFEYWLKLSRGETAENINHRRAELRALARSYGSTRRRDELARNLPSLKEAWGPDVQAFNKLSETYDRKIEQCLDKVALKMANLPDAAEAERYRKEVVSPTKERLCSLLQKNLSEKSSRFLCARIAEMEAVVPTTQSVFEELSRDFKWELEVWATPLPKEPSLRRISAYGVYYPTWLNEGCWSKDDAQLERGLGLGKQTDAYNRLTGQIHPSDVAVKARYAGALGHEMLHGVEQWMAARDISSKSREDKAKIDQCIKRKQPASPRTSETFADLGVVSSQAENEVCLLPSEDGEPFLSWDEDGHASKLFRVLHVKSYGTKPLPASCQQFLESIGQKDLFKERCVALP